MCKNVSTYKFIMIALPGDIIYEHLHLCDWDMTSIS